MCFFSTDSSKSEANLSQGLADKNMLSRIRELKYGGRGGQYELVLREIDTL